MAEYIDRNAVFRAIDRQRGPTRSFAQNNMLDSLRAAMLCIRAADVAPVRHGQWDGEGDGYADGELVIDVWYCSCCGHCVDDGTDDPTILPNYCPNCGAKMDGDG